MKRREFLSLLFGSAAVVGFETMFGLKPVGQSFLAPGHVSADPVLLGVEDFQFSMKPGALNYVTGMATLPNGVLLILE